MDNDRMFTQFSCQGTLTADRDVYKCMNQPLGLEIKYLYLRTLLGTMEVGYLPGNLRGSELLEVSVHRELTDS
jgi:hypothetical protein